MELKGKDRECSPGLHNLSGGCQLLLRNLWFTAGHHSSSLQGSQSSFSVTGSGEAAGRSTGPTQCVRHWLHPQDLSLPDRSVLDPEELRARAASDRFPAQTPTQSPGNGLPRAVRLMTDEN